MKMNMDFLWGSPRLLSCAGLPVCRLGQSTPMFVSPSSDSEMNSKQRSIQLMEMRSVMTAHKGHPWGLGVGGSLLHHQLSGLCLCLYLCLWLSFWAPFSAYYMLELPSLLSYGWLSIPCIGGWDPREMCILGTHCHHNDMILLYFCP